MSHKIYELAHSPCRHNLFISLKTFCSIDAASLLWTEYSGGESSLWEPTLLPKSFIFLFDWLFHVSAVLLGSQWSGWSAYLFFPAVPSSLLFFFFLWTVHETCLSDWLVLRGRWIQRTHWLDLCWGGKQPFLRIRFSLIQSMGKRSKENIERVGLLLELLLVRFLDVHVLNLYFQSDVECTHRQADKVLFWFYAWTHLHSLCPCLWQLIMMSIHSYLLGSGWFLISGEHPFPAVLVTAA